MGLPLVQSQLNEIRQEANQWALASGGRFSLSAE
jgi:hypothetical protein